MTKGARLAVVLLAALAGGCSSGREDPETQIRALLQRGEAAAEQKQAAVLRALLSDQYADPQGQDKKAIEAVIRYYFLRHQSIHLFTRIRGISFPQPENARADVLVAMAAQPIAGAGELERLRADLHRFEITFVREQGEWKVRQAEWRRAELGDFF